MVARIMGIVELRLAAHSLEQTLISWLVRWDMLKLVSCKIIGLNKHAEKQSMDRYFLLLSSQALLRQIGSLRNERDEVWITTQMLLHPDRGPVRAGDQKP